MAAGENGNLTEEKTVKATKEKNGKEAGGDTQGSRKKQTGRRNKVRKQKNDISYQNKDITSKIFGEWMLERSFCVYGLKLPKVKRLLPTNLPQIQANENRLDNFYLLEDDSVLIVDYESEYSEQNKLKYMDYIRRVLARHLKDRRILVRMVVIYTADVERRQTRNVLDAGAVVIRTEDAFLSEIKSEEVRQNLERKIRNREKLSDEEVMQFILYPMTYRTKEEKIQAIHDSIELAEQMDYYDDGEKTVRFILAGIVVFSDKVIDEATKNAVKERMRMTGVGRLFLQEQEEAVRKAVKKAVKKAVAENTKEVTRKVTNNVTEKVKDEDWQKIYGNCLERGMSEKQAREIADCLK